MTSPTRSGAGFGKWKGSQRSIPTVPSPPTYGRPTGSRTVSPAVWPTITRTLGRGGVYRQLVEHVESKREGRGSAHAKTPLVSRP